MENFENIYNKAKKSLKILGGIFDKEKVESRLKELELISSKENFWKDQYLVKKTVKQKKFLEDIFNSYIKLTEDLKNINDLFELACEERRNYSRL